MSAADYRLMTEATGQRIAAALEALQLTGLGDPVTIAHGGTGATTADGACESIGAVKKSGDTMTGLLAIKSADGVWSTIDLVSQSGFYTGQVAANHLSNFMTFREISPSGKSEFYKLPDADNTQNDAVYSILTGKTPVTVAQGGTGKENLADLQSMIFGGYTLSGITAYPTSPGLYRNTDSLSTGMPTGASLYGTLIIIAGGETSYNLHLYADATQDLYYAFTDNVNPPSEWRKVTSTTVASRT